MGKTRHSNCLSSTLYTSHVLSHHTVELLSVWLPGGMKLSLKAGTHQSSSQEFYEVAEGLREYMTNFYSALIKTMFSQLPQ